MASIDKRGNYQWRVRINRKGYKVTETFSYKEDAERWARKVEGEIDRGIFFDNSEAEKTSLAEALDRYVETVSPRKKGNSYKIEKSRSRTIKKNSLSRKKLAHIRSRDIAEYITDRENDNVRNNTIRLELALISHLYTVAASSWGMEGLHNPVKSAQKPSVKNDARERRLLPGEENRLMEGCKSFASPHWLKTTILLALETAMRRSEIANMSWKWVDLKNCVVYIPIEDSKTKVRTVPLSLAALTELKSLPRNIDGKVISVRPDQVSKQFKRLCDNLKIAGLHFHDLRHEATTRLFEMGWRTSEVMAMTGHSTAQMANRYTHLEAHNLVKKLHRSRPAAE
ncbi:MAG: site-specific integrase [Mariprofundaceae bacterium]|nr:site-specific integrase [Mariprofundaceae bacterium]